MVQLGEKPNVLVTGGSGYLGQFLVHGLAHDHNVHYTYGTRLLASAPEGVVAHKVDLATGEGLQQVFEKTRFHAVVNCAAISQPGVCESDPAGARAVNVPSHLVDCLLRQAQAGSQALLIHISTDQVYDGTRALWKEDDPLAAVNAYGRSKLEAEQHVLSRLPEPYPLAILRSSIIYGPPAPDPVPRALFLQFVASAVAGDKPTTFFEDEWRNPVYVRDLERLVRLLMRRHEGAEGAAGVAGAGAEAPRQHRVYNAGGPERLSRVDMARQVADCLGCGHGAIVAAPSASVSRGVASPPDISMDVSRLQQDLGFSPRPFREALAEIFPPPAAEQ